MDTKGDESLAGYSIMTANGRSRPPDPNCCRAPRLRGLKLRRKLVEKLLPGLLESAEQAIAALGLNPDYPGCWSEIESAQIALKKAIRKD